MYQKPIELCKESKKKKEGDKKRVNLTVQNEFSKWMAFCWKQSVPNAFRFTDDGQRREKTSQWYCKSWGIFCHAKIFNCSVWKMNVFSRFFLTFCIINWLIPHFIHTIHLVPVFILLSVMYYTAWNQLLISNRHVFCHYLSCVQKRSFSFPFRHCRFGTGQLNGKAYLAGN